MPLPNEKPATAVFDKGRRGQPLPGCDCVQCFGYCIIDGDEAIREGFMRGQQQMVSKDDE